MVVRVCSSIRFAWFLKILYSTNSYELQWIPAAPPTIIQNIDVNIDVWDDGPDAWNLQSLATWYLARRTPLLHWDILPKSYLISSALPYWSRQHFSITTRKAPRPVMSGNSRLWRNLQTSLSLFSGYSRYPTLISYKTVPSAKMSSFSVWFNNRSAGRSGLVYRIEVATRAVEPSRIDPQKSASASEPSFWIRKLWAPMSQWMTPLEWMYRTASAAWIGHLYISSVNKDSIWYKKNRISNSLLTVSFRQDTFPALDSSPVFPRTDIEALDLCQVPTGPRRNIAEWKGECRAAHRFSSQLHQLLQGCQGSWGLSQCRVPSRLARRGHSRQVQIDLVLPLPECGTGKSFGGVYGMGGLGEGDCEWEGGGSKNSGGRRDAQTRQTTRLD